MIKGKSIKELEPAIVLALSFGFMIFLYAPLELYFSNKSEFWFDAYTVIPVMAAVFLSAAVIYILISALFYLIHKRVYQLWLILSFITFICTYIQGNFLVAGLPELSGSPIFWELYTSERIKCIAMWIIITIIVCIVVKVIKMQKFYSVVKYAGTFITLVLLVTIISVCVMNNGLEKKQALCITDKIIMEMSDDTNVIVLLLDSLDSRKISEAFQNNEELKQLFNDFTYYPNMATTYGYTHESVPYILSGMWYENEEPFEAYQKKVYDTSPLFSLLEENNYKTGVYTSEVPLTDSEVIRFDNVLDSKNKITSYQSFIKYWMKLVGYKYAPFDMKAGCVFDRNSFLNLKMPPEGTSVFTDDNRAFYKKIQNEEIVHTQDKVFKFIHLEGAHAPYCYSADMRYLGYEASDYDQTIQACITLASEYIKKLKENGVYDNSAIIIMSDHGYEADDNPWGRWNGTFMVKGIGEKHDFAVYNAPVSYEDLQTVYERLVNGQTGTDLFDWKEGAVRVRRYMYYNYGDEENMYEGAIDGWAGDTNAMTLTGNEYHRK